MVKLEADVDQRQLYRLAEQFYLNATHKILIEETRQYWAMNGIQAMFQTLAKKRLQTPENQLRFYFYNFKLQGLRWKTEMDIHHRRSQMTIGQQIKDKREVDQRQRNISNTMSVVDISAVNNKA